MDTINQIDRAIKLVWKEDIKKDYDHEFILKEDSLKNAFYHHLRVRLGDGFLIKHKIRIFTEYYLRNNERADLAIVSLQSKKEMTEKNYHLRDRVEKLFAVIEFKHKGYSCGVDPFFKDVDKVKKYIRLKSYLSCQFYLGFIHETEYTTEEASWLSKRQQESWAVGRLTELSAFHEVETGYFDMKIISYNKLNQELNSYDVNVI